MSSFPSPFYRWRPHPWHGLEVGPDAPEVVTAYIEITPFDAVKYEIDKTTGYTRVDRPQRSSAQPPTLYGFIPRTYCAERVAALSADEAAVGDGDPLDICVVSERPIDRGDILLDARVIGGLQLVDNGEADDKIIAVLRSDPVFEYAKDLKHLPSTVVERIVHYFGTYKMQFSQGGNTNRIEVVHTYGVDHARRVVGASMADYTDTFVAADSV